MNTNQSEITQAMRDAVGAPVERAVTLPEIGGLVYLQLWGGQWAIFNRWTKNALKQRFPGLEAARAFTIERLVSRGK